MWTKIIASVATNKKARNIAISLALLVLGLLIIAPVAVFIVVLSPVLLIVGFFTSFFGTGSKPPIHPLQKVATEIGCEANIFDLNTIDIIENQLFTYSKSDENLNTVSESSEGVPVYSKEHLEKIKTRYINYYFDQVSVRYTELGGNRVFCSLRYLSDVFDDIQQDDPNISDQMIDEVVGELKRIINYTFAPIVEYDHLSIHNFGNSGIFGNYDYAPSKRGITKTKGELYSFVDFNAKNTHRGMDYPLNIGTPIYSKTTGIVSGTANFYEDNYLIESGIGAMGNYVKIVSRFPGDDSPDSLSRMELGYLHLQKGSVVVKVGQVVEAGELIGFSGNTGQSTGAHLDFRVMLNSNELGLTNYYINPYSLTLQDLYINPKYKGIEVPQERTE